VRDGKYSRDKEWQMSVTMCMASAEIEEGRGFSVNRWSKWQVQERERMEYECN